MAKNDIVIKSKGEVFWERVKKENSRAKEEMEERLKLLNAMLQMCDEKIQKAKKE